MDNYKLRVLAGLSTDRSVMEKKWSGEVQEKKHPPEGLFASGSRAKIVAWLKSNHKDLRSAMASLSFYINRAGENLDQARRTELEAAKDDLRSAFMTEQMNFIRKAAGLPELKNKVSIRENDEAAPETAPEEVKDQEGEDEECKDEECKDEDDEQTLDSMIKKLAQHCQGKDAAEIEKLLMQVYAAGQQDAAPCDDEEECKDE